MNEYARHSPLSDPFPLHTELIISLLLLPMYSRVCAIDLHLQCTLPAHHWQPRAPGDMRGRFSLRPPLSSRPPGRVTHVLCHIVSAAFWHICATSRYSHRPYGVQTSANSTLAFSAPRVCAPLPGHDHLLLRLEVDALLYQSLQDIQAAVLCGDVERRHSRLRRRREGETQSVYLSEVEPEVASTGDPARSIATGVATLNPSLA